MRDIRSRRDRRVRGFLVPPALFLLRFVPVIVVILDVVLLWIDGEGWWSVLV